MSGRLTFIGEMLATGRGKTARLAVVRDKMIRRGQTFVVVSKKKGGGLHCCTIVPFRRRR